MKAVSLAIAFCLELVTFAAICLLAFLLPVHPFLQFVIAVLLLAAITWFWATFMSPKAKHELHGRSYYAAQVIIYTIAATALFYKLGAVACIVFIAVYVADELAIHFTSR